MRFSFGLKWLLLLIAVSAVAMWSVTQLGTTVATFEITGTQLTESSRGRVSGPLAYRFSRMDAEGTTIYGDFLCSISNLNQPGLVGIANGRKYRVRYRNRAWWPFQREDPHRKFLTQALKIDGDEIVGYAIMEGWTEIVIGKSGGD